VKPHALFTAKLAEVLDAAADIASPAVGVKISFGFPCRFFDLLYPIVHNQATALKHIDVKTYTVDTNRCACTESVTKNCKKSTEKADGEMNFAKGTIKRPRFKLQQMKKPTNRVVCIGGATEGMTSPEPASTCDLWYGHYYGDKFGQGKDGNKRVPQIKGNPGLESTTDPGEVSPYRRETKWVKSEFLMTRSERSSTPAAGFKKAPPVLGVGLGSILQAGAPFAEPKAREDWDAFIASLGPKGSETVQNVCVLLREAAQEPEVDDRKYFREHVLQQVIDFVSRDGGTGKILIQGPGAEKPANGEKIVSAQDPDHPRVLISKGYLDYGQLMGANWCTHAFVGRGAGSVLEPVLLAGIPAFADERLDQVLGKGDPERKANQNALTRYGIQPGLLDGSSTTDADFEAKVTAFLVKGNTNAATVKRLIEEFEGRDGANAIGWLLGAIYEQFSNDERMPIQKEGREKRENVSTGNELITKFLATEVKLAFPKFGPAFSKYSGVDISKYVEQAVKNGNSIEAELQKLNTGLEKLEEDAEEDSWEEFE